MFASPLLRHTHIHDSTLPIPIHLHLAGFFTLFNARILFWESFLS
jgi:hypothetical protein